MKHLLTLYSRLWVIRSYFNTGRTGQVSSLQIERRYEPTPQIFAVQIAQPVEDATNERLPCDDRRVRYATKHRLLAPGSQHAGRSKELSEAGVLQIQHDSQISLSGRKQASLKLYVDPSWPRPQGRGQNGIIESLSICSHNIGTNSPHYYYAPNLNPITGW